MLQTARTGDRAERIQGDNSHFLFVLECILISPQYRFPVFFPLLYGARQSFAGQPAVSAHREWLRFGNSVHACMTSSNLQCYGKQRCLSLSFLHPPYKHAKNPIAFSNRPHCNIAAPEKRSITDAHSALQLQLGGMRGTSSGNKPALRSAPDNRQVFVHLP